MPDTNNRKLKVFLCHASEDKPAVRELYKRLKREKWIDPWLDAESLLPGQDWDVEIYKATRDADAIIIAFSEKSVQKEGYVNKEIRRVLEIAQEKPEGMIYIIPLRLDVCEPSFRELKRVQWVDYFDPSGYERLLKSLLLRFDKLEKVNNARQMVVQPKRYLEHDNDWFNRHRSFALSGMQRKALSGFLEVKLTILDDFINFPQNELLDIARHAQIHTFGWPIGVVLETIQDGPKPIADGIKTEIESNIADMYDYWVLRNNGDFYLMKSLFEDNGRRWQKNTVIAFNTRIQRATEILSYCHRLYEMFGLESATKIGITIKVGGLKNRTLTSSTNRFLSRENSVCIESEIENSIRVELSDIQENIVSLVKELMEPLFLLFGFQQFADSVYEDIVTNYINGRIT